MVNQEKKKEHGRGGGVLRGIAALLAGQLPDQLPELAEGQLAVGVLVQRRHEVVHRVRLTSLNKK